MNEPKDHAWVTSAFNDTECLGALVLCRSLRRVFTTRKIIVLISSSISLSLRQILEKEFNATIEIDFSESLKKQFSLNALAKLFTWKLTLFTKCVYVEPKSMVVENCDELFDLEDFSASANSTVFVCTPAYNVYNSFLQLVETKNGSNQDLFKYCIEKSNFTKQTGKLLGCQYETLLSESTVLEEILSERISIINFTGNNPWKIFAGKNIARQQQQQCNQIFAQVWMNIFSEDIIQQNNSHLELPKEIRQQFESYNLARNNSTPTHISKDYNTNLNDAIAVVGLSCRFPGANNPDEFWDLLINGKDAVRPVPFGRWDAKDVEVDEGDLRKTKAGFLKCAIDQFDAKFYGISPREATYLDPQQRLLLEVAWEGLENAGINPLSLKGTKTGVYIGVWTADYEALLRKHTTGSNAHRVYLGNAYSATSARISFFLGLNGPNIATESGCSSSFVSLHLACESLRKKESNLTLAGGVNLLLHPFSLIGSEKPYFMASDGHCKTFDSKADGFGRAEGCGIVVLKRFADAVRDGDRIAGVIRGSALNMEGTTASFGTPSKSCQEMVIKEALKNARVDPAKVSYVEAHGTGTMVGDPIEISAMIESYSKNRKEPLLIGSVKTNIGHAEGAAGIAGLIKVLLAMKNNTIPPHRNFESLNPDIPLDKIPGKIPVNAEKWENVNGESRLAAISSYGISGSNVHVVVEDPPTTQKIMPSIRSFERPTHILTFSAKDEIALQELKTKYIAFLKENSHLDLADIAYTSNVGRGQFFNRLAVIGNSSEDIVDKLSKTQHSIGKATHNKSKLAFLFTGQGSQYSGMAKMLYESNAVFKNALDKCEKILENNIGVSIIKEIWAEQENSRLDQTLFSQTSIFCIEYSLLKLWNSFGVFPDFVFGHSVGEFAAATAAGILRLEDALKLVSHRSKLIQGLPPGGMLAIKTSVDSVKSLIEKFRKTDSELWLDIAVVNSCEEVVVAGLPNALEKFSELCATENIKTQKVAASHAFHSRAMDNILDSFGKVAESISYENPRCGYISGRDGRQLQRKDLSATYWQNHARDTVNFPLAMKTLHEAECRVFLEIGPHPVLLALALNNLSAEESQDCLWLPSIRKSEPEWQTMLGSLGKLFVNGCDVDFKGVDMPYKRNKVELPSYPFQRKRFWFESTAEPNSLTCNTKILHPLLGRHVPVATNDMFVNVYQQTISLENLTYLSDHVVANRVIMPGAGFFEMILATASLALQGDHEGLSNPRKAFVISDFLIEAPLELFPEKPCRLQLVTSPESVDKTEILKAVIFRKFNDNNITPWKKHATATIQLSVKDIPAEWHDQQNLEEIRNRCQTSICTEEFYKKIAEAGIAFGTTFQSIKEFFKGENEVLTEVFAPPSVTDKREYICHPIALDAMLQAYAFQVDLTKIDLYLPVAIEKFTWLPNEVTNRLYLHLVWTVEGEGQRKGLVKILNEHGSILGVMQGVRLVKTNLTAFVNFLNAQKRDVPELYQEVFRPKVGILSSRIDLEKLPSVENVMSLVDQRFAELRKEYTYDIDDLLKRISQLCFYYFVNALYELGWSPAVGKTFETRELLLDLLISFRYEKFVNCILVFFVEHGVLEHQVQSRNKGSWSVVKAFPRKADLKNLITDLENLINRIAPQGVELPVLKRCSKYMSSVIQEKESPLFVLFPDQYEENAIRIYIDAEYTTNMNKGAQVICEKLFENLEDKNSKVVRVLEVGGGTGSTMKYVIEALKKVNVSYSYVFTDIARTLLDQTQQKFKDVPRISYKALDIENDPKSQGFAPHQFDLVICSNVLHATRDLEETMGNVRQLLKPSGYLVTIEMFTLPPHIFLTFGLLDGFFRFRDLKYRQNNPLVDLEKWKMIGHQTGFQQLEGLHTKFPEAGVFLAQASKTEEIYRNIYSEEEFESTWIIFGERNDGVYSSIKEKLERDGRKVLLLSQSENFSVKNSNEYKINPLSCNDFKSLFEEIEKNKLTIEGMLYLWPLGAEEPDQNKIVSGLFHFCQSMLKYMLKKLPNLVIVSSGVYYIGDEGPRNPTAGILRGFLLSLKSEQPGLKIEMIDLDPNEVDHEASMVELYSELWANENEMQVALRQRKRFVKRLVQMEKFPVPLIIPESERYKLILPESKSLSDLVLSPIPLEDIPSGQYEVLVKAVGLNFRDLFVILKPDMFVSRFWEVGLEFSGVVTRIGPKATKFKAGDEVFGFTLQGGIANYTFTREDLIMRKPSSMTHAEAATMPTVFFTVYVSLVEEAKIKSTDTVLIHVASGGVGIAAIQVCRQYGAKIVATAGSRRKRAYLRSIGIEHVFHSRNISYGDDILGVTNGKGVDIVLNSLTGPNFKETSLRICKPKARFIEMSKINIWTVEEVKERRPDVSYTIVNLEYGLDHLNNSPILEVESLIANKIYTPLPYTKFDVTQTKEAFDYFQKAQHIGKIVVTMPSTKYSKGTLAIQENMFNSDATYLITGGLGGIGLEVTKFIARSGGRNIVLISRNPPNSNAEDVIKSLTSKGINIITKQVDVGNYEEVKDLLQTLEDPQMNLPPLRGVMHAAGFIVDGVIPNLNMEKFNAVFNAKVMGAWNLHHLTRNYNLEHFILYSSAAGLLGPMGQANHAAANTFLDTFAHYRHALGLPIQTINWGIWSEVGAAAELALSKDGAFGIKPFTPTQGIAALKATMRYHYLQVAVTEIDRGQFKHDVLNLGTYIEEIASSAGAISAELVAEGEKIWKEIKEAEPGKRADIIKGHIEIMIRQTLKLPEEEPLDENQSFSDMGLDSLMAVEMRNKLQLIFGKNVTLNTTALLDNPNIRALSSYLAELITSSETSSGGSGIVVVNEDALSDLVMKDSILPEDIQISSPPPPISDVKNIFITGVTGKLGIFILPELLKREHLNVTCLIRARSDGDALKRLKQSLRKVKLLESINFQNVQCVAGNVAKKNFDMSQEKYNQLANGIDAIIHCAVKSNHIDSYKVAKSHDALDMRSVNVIGTRNILQFAAASKTKHVLHASSLVAVTKCNSDGSLEEELPEDNDFGKDITWGYALSKFICEKLVKQAVDRGIPCTVLRFPNIVGDSESGKFSPESNHLIMFLLACMHIGLAPDIKGAWSCIPVDTAARATTQIFLDPEANDNIKDNRVFNIVNPLVTNQPEMQAITTGKGYPMKIVPEKEWTDELTTKVDNTLLHTLKDLYVEGGMSTFLHSSPVVDMALKDDASGKLFSISQKLQRTLPEFETTIPNSAEIFKRHIEYAEVADIFKLFNTL